MKRFQSHFLFFLILQIESTQLFQQPVLHGCIHTLTSNSSCGEMRLLLWWWWLLLWLWFQLWRKIALGLFSPGRRRRRLLFPHLLRFILDDGGSGGSGRRSRG